LLARRREPARLLVIGSYRPVDVIVQEHPLQAVKQELQLHGLCEELPLGLLSEQQVAEYLAQRFNVGAPDKSPLQPSLAKAIHCRTDGNPLFPVTAVDDLVGQHVLVENKGHWVVQGELAAIETRIPDSL
jgi:predicted ATPase